VATALSLSDAAMGAVFSAFALGYAFAQIPSGWLADRFGPRVTLAFVVALWSVFTVLTGVASGLATLLVVRFLFGAAEAGAFPGSARVIYNWLPPRMHGIANGILFSGALVGGAVAEQMPYFMGDDATVTVVRKEIADDGFKDQATQETTSRRSGYA